MRTLVAIRDSPKVRDYHRGCLGARLSQTKALRMASEREQFSAGGHDL
jgi:hypothetical protein